MAKFLDLKTKDEDIMEKFKEKQKKKIFNQSLNQQLKQREMFCQKENDIEKTLIKKQIDQFKIIEERDKKYHEEKLRRIKDEKERMLSYNIGK